MTRRNAILIFILSLIGLAASLYLTNLHLQIFTGKLEEFGFCGLSREISCEAVSASPYSRIFGVPLAWLGSLLYLFWLALAAIAAYKPDQHARVSTGLLLITATAAVAGNIYLGQLMFFTIGSLCLLCLLTYLINIVVLILALRAAQGTRIATASAAIKVMLPFSGETRFGFVLTFILIVAAGIIGQFQMQKAIDAAAKFDEAGFRKFQQTFERLQVDTASDPFHGAADARLTMVEFSNFECPHCRKAHFILQTILPTYRDQVKLVFKNRPFDNNPSAGNLARLGEAAHKQGKFWPVHDIIFERQKQFGKTPLDRDALMQLARDAGLDMARLEKDYDDPAAAQAVAADVQEATRLKINGTPVFLLNGLLIRGMPSPAILKKIIELELERANAN